MQVHGLLHLWGFDQESRDEAKVEAEMEKKELRLKVSVELKKINSDCSWYQRKLTSLKLSRG